MRDLVAQVTSSLLHFPEVTVDALGEDEVTLDSVLHGKFTVGRNGLAWLACGPQLEVVHSVTGERFSAYCFSSVSENPPTVLAVRDFSWLKRTGLLVGLEEAEGSMLCLYDLGISRVVKAVVIPGRITAVEPLVSYGGASTSTQHLHQSLRWFFGVAAVVTDIGHVLLVDLCLDDLSCSQTELEASGLEIVNKSPSDIPRLREGVTRQGRHLCLQLSSPTGTGVTALQYVSRTNQLAVGFSDGYLQLWNMKTLKKEYHSQLEGGRVPVYAFTFQEPENDPRNCCYLWAVQSAQDHEGDVVSLHLLQLAFGERKCLHSGKILYEGLEYCEERYSQDLNGTAIPLRAQATNTRLLSCQTIEKFRHHPDRDDSMNEVASPDTSVSIFSWQVKSYGQGKPSTYIGVFDINRWYHAQMPDALRAGESLRSCPYLAVWTLDSVVEMTSPCTLLDVLVHERSLSRGLPFTCPPPEQFFNPTTYNFDASCLLNSGIVHLTCSGYQKETLSYLKKSGPSLSESISNGYSRCLMSGLLSTRLADVQPSNLSQVQQLDAILSTAVESSSLGLITGCIKQCKTEDQPGSVVNLRYILEWAWDKVVQAKEELDSICAPLFDSTSNFTDPQTLQLLQHSQLLLSNLSTIFTCLLNEAQELTHKGLVGLFNKNLVSALIAQYAQVVLWFCRTGLLPEGSDDDALQLSRPFYSYVVIKNYYSGRREELQRLSKGKWCSDCLMVDGLVAQCSQRLGDLWKRDEGGTGQYPPSSLHALLDIYLLENVEESDKHAVVIYLLLDVMYSFPNKSGASVESFPTAFAIPIGLVKLVQGLWLLDHRDHENSLELLLHPATSHSMWSWQHDRVLQALMCQGQHKLALRYMHVMKPPTSSTSQAKLSLLVLLHNRCMVEAWTLLRQHSNKLNMEELLHFLFETCQELDLIKELLKLPLGMAEQDCLERFLQGTGGLQNRELLMVHYLQQANYIPALQLNQTLKMNLLNDRDPKLKERSNTRNSILDQYGKVLPRAQWKLATERAKPYSHPSTIFKKVSRPQPLSTLPKRSATENVMTRSTFINNVLSKIEEVWVGKDKPKSSTFNCSTVPEVLVPSPPRPSMEVPEAFVSTPITNSKRMSRLLDRVVHPSSQNSPEAAGPLSQTPTRTPYLWPASKSLSKAPELSLLQTPQVVKRARALAASGTSAFSSFTPHSILRSSQRTTPVATPSASPGRSVTPSLRPKESRITFIEEASSPGPEPPKGQVHWSNGGVADGEVSLLKRSGKGSWSLHQSREEEDEQEPSLTLAPQTQKSILEENESQSGSSVQDVSLVLPTLVQRPSLGHDVSVASVDQSGNTDVEFHDAPEPEGSVNEGALSHEHHEEEIVEEFVVVKQHTLSQDLSSAEESISPSEPAEHVHSPEQVHESSPEFTLDVREENDDKALVPVAEELEVNEDSAHEMDSEPVLGQDSELHPTLMRGELQPNSVPGEPSIEPTVPEISCPAPVVAEQSNHQPELESSNSDEANLERSLEEQEAKDLDEFLEHQLFHDLSPPHSPTQNWSSFNSNQLAPDQKQEAPPLTTQTSSAPSEPTTSDSHSVVSLNDSEELSSTASEDQSDAEEEEEEDSGSEVEIIDEVEGNGRQHPELFLEELSPHDQYIQEQATAVLSVVTPETQVVEGLMLGEEEEGQVMMVTLAGDVNNEHDAVCYTELKPSTTLLVPLELTEDHHLVDGGLTALSTETAEPTGGFSLMLEAEDEDEHGGAMLDPNSQLLIMNIPQEVKHTDDYEQQINTDVVMNPMVQEPQMETVVPTEVLDQDDKGVLGDELEEDCMQEVTPMGAGIPVVPFIARLDDEHLESEAAKPELEPVTLDVNDLKDLPAEIEDTTPTEDRGLVNGISVEVEADLEKRAPDVPVVSEPEVLESSMPSMANESEKPHEDQCLENEQLCAHESDKQDAVNSFHDNQEHPGLENAEGMKAAFQSKSTAQICAEKADLESAIPPVTTRKSSGHKKAVTFPSHVSDAEKVQSDGEAQVPSTPRRVTRSSKQLQDYQVPVTPKRSVRKSEVKASGEEAPAALTNAQIDTKAEPSKRQTPQKATPRKGSRRTRSTIVESEEEEEEAAAAAAVGPLPTEVSGRRSARKTQATDRSGEASEVLAVVPEVKPAAPSSPSRLRKSTRRLSLTLENFPPMDVEVSSLAPVTPPRSRRQTRAGTVEKAKEAPLISDDVQPLGVVRRLTRSQHWNPLEDLEKEKEERPLLDTPVEVGSGMPLTDALMERLKDEAREGNSGPAVTEVIHPRRRKAPVQRAPSPPASVPDVEVTQTEEFKPDTGTDGVQDPPVVRRGSAGRRTRASKVPDPESSPVRDFNFTPQKKTRGRKTDAPLQNTETPSEEISHPVTRTRHTTNTESNTSEDASELPQATKSRTKRSARAKAASALPPPVEIVFLSPIATPEESTSRTQRRVEEQQEDKEKEPSSLRMNLRRKRVMDAIFPKPVTRRRKF
ncbi:protein ELYS [Denticeps clupeoides]|uniref:Protein ELYS n=1 Tax=Denticeps clupeoides TaxID=299321 RepID=A0AAY4ABQ3_9TELE|nr:protein ELYS [Denticeps clupeoides]